MATTDQIINMVKAYSANDDDRFRTVVLQIAAHEAKLGHGNIAQELKKEADNLEKKRTVLKMTSTMGAMLEYTTPSVKLIDLIAGETVIKKIKRILLEYQNKKKLHNSGLNNRRKILLEGNPGTGKTMTAAIIASELGLPLFTVQVDKLVTKFMGETSIRLRQIFENMAFNNGVYLFDEFDAIGADRAMDNEVGEMRRILNAFLQFIEMDVSESIIIAATNNQKILDKALFRRFDDVIHYDLPDDEQIQRLYEHKLNGFAEKNVYGSDVIRASRGLSHAELSMICDDVLKDSILFNKTISKDSIITLVKERQYVYQRMEA